MPETDSAMQIGIALRAAHIAKQSLEMMQLPPRLCKMQILEITECLKELQQFLNQKGIPTT
jgi:hypothetical protein